MNATWINAGGGARCASKIDIAVLHVLRRFDSLWTSVNTLLADGKRRQFGESFEGRLAHGADLFRGISADNRVNTRRREFLLPAFRLFRLPRNDLRRVAPP